MSSSSNLRRNNSYVESIDDEYLPLPSSPSPSPLVSASSPTNNSKPFNSNKPKATEIFHRKMYSADAPPHSAPNSRNFEFTSKSFLFPTNHHRASPPDYYQLTLQQEEEDRHRRDLYSLIYSPPPLPITPPSHPPPSVPSTSSESRLESFFGEQPTQLEKSKLYNNLCPPKDAFRNLRAVSTDSTFYKPQKQEAFDVEEEDLEEILTPNEKNRFPSDSENNTIEETFDEIKFDLDNNYFFDNQIETMKPPLLEMAKEKERKLVVLNDIGKNNKDFSLSADENFAPSELSPPSTTTTTSTPSLQNSHSSRSQSEPPKHRLQPTTNATPKNNKKEKNYFKIDEEGGEGGNNHHQIDSHELSLFFCSPSSVISHRHSDSMMELMNTSSTSELPITTMINSLNNHEDGEKHQYENSLDVFSVAAANSSCLEMISSKPDDVFTFDEVEVEHFRRKKPSFENIQSRPLPPLPPFSNNNINGDDEEEEMPEEPDDIAPDLEMSEPEYACVDDDYEGGCSSYEAIHHQRSISDHVLGYSQRREEQIKSATTDLKKSNSDRTERRSTRRKTTHDEPEQQQQQMVIVEEILSNPISSTADHQRAMSCSTPSILHQQKQPQKNIIHQDEIDGNGGGEIMRKRSTTTDSIESSSSPASAAAASNILSPKIINQQLKQNQKILKQQPQTLSKCGGIATSIAIKAATTGSRISDEYSRQQQQQGYITGSIRLRNSTNSMSTLESKPKTATEPPTSQKISNIIPSPSETTTELANTNSILEEITGVADVVDTAATQKPSSSVNSSKKNNLLTQNSLSSLVDRFTSRRQISLPQMQGPSSFPSSSTSTSSNIIKTLNSKESPLIRRSFKWKNIFSSKQQPQQEQTTTATSSPLPTLNLLQKSASTTSMVVVKLRKPNSISPPKLSTLQEDNDSFDTITTTKINQEKISQKNSKNHQHVDRPWRSFLTRSFIHNSDSYNKKDNEHKISLVSVSPTNFQQPRRRVSVIGDIECDRKQFAPSPDACAKLDDALRKQFCCNENHTNHANNLFPSDSCFYSSSSITSSDDEDGGEINDYQNYHDKPNKPTTTTTTTPRRGRKPIIHRMKSSTTLPRFSNNGCNSNNKNNSGDDRNLITSPMPLEYSTRTLQTPRKLRGVQKRWKQREQIKRRKSCHQAYIENVVVGVIENEKMKKNNSQLIEPSTSNIPLAAAEITGNIGKRKTSKKFLSTVAVGDINKGETTTQTNNNKYEKDRKVSNFLGILSLKTHRRKKDNRSLGNLYPNYNNSNSTINGHFSNQSESQKSDESALPDVLSDVLRPSVGSPSETGSYQNRTSMITTCFVDYPKPQLVKPKWQDLDLWEDEPGSWSAKHPHVQVSSSEKKRQNIIYEFYMTEKNHCRVIILLQQVYQVGLRSIISDKDLCTLIPDVLDSLLDFHLNLLRRLKERREKSIVVETVSDIVAEEFNKGEYIPAAINAYTSFCLAKEESGHAYHTLIEKYSDVKRFFDFYESNPMYKQHNFKSCFLLVAQRLTKYNLLFDQLLKYEPSANKPQTQLALESVRDLARRVDTELKNNEIQQKWELLKLMLDKKSRGKIVKKDFTYDDLVHQRLDNPRQAKAIGKVYYLSSSASQTKGDKIELTMVLFDDILVLFCLKNNSMHFCNYNMMSSVIPLRTLLVREMERTHECILLCTDKEKPDMYHLEFPTKNDLMNWMRSIGDAKVKAPQHVRFAPGRKAEDTLKKEEEFNEDPHDKKVQDWQDELQAMFHERKPKEEFLRDYMSGRMRFFDDIRTHFKKFPIRHVNASSSSLPSAGAMLERRETKDLEKVKKLVQQKFHELRQHRRSGFDSLVEVAQKARDNDLESFFDDLNDLAIVTSSSSDASESERIPTSATSSEDEPVSSVSLASVKSKPRRVRTYHGTMDSSSAHPRDGSIRRHTTVPKLGKRDGVIATDDEDEVEGQINIDLRKLPLSMPTRSRKAATLLIHENVNLRIENNKLKSEIAMQELQISSLKSRKTAVIENAEKLESLRQKQEEIQTRERQLKQQHENFKDESRRKNDQFEAREDDLRRREAELISRMQNGQLPTLRSGAAIFKDSSNEQPPPTPHISSPSHAIHKLATKSVTKRK